MQEGIEEIISKLLKEIPKQNILSKSRRIFCSSFSKEEKKNDGFVRSLNIAQIVT